MILDNGCRLAPSRPNNGDVQLPGDRHSSEKPLQQEGELHRVGESSGHAYC